ncbi:hypothetical protein BN874_1070003 [Candidatus Contendobacter odensis Run_B_J11]|uniref:Uncharacterized protein n=1 Tax=Candidatus Contendobacter odensis Run_B_J11 TaxID=1400861 RepID=A0A7U7G7V5_9GAMM|nr:hypothetical protein BN874_1070003 [Candidatus Contendobacter odensis Run_B_J11]
MGKALTYGLVCLRRVSGHSPTWSG